MSNNNFKQLYLKKKIRKLQIIYSFDGFRIRYILRERDDLIYPNMKLKNKNI